MGHVIDSTNLGLTNLLGLFDFNLILLNLADLMILNFFYFFRNSSVTFTLFFLHPEIFGLARSVTLAIDKILLRLCFFLKKFFLLLSVFSIWFIIIEIFNLFRYEFHDFITISHLRSWVL